MYGSDVITQNKVRKFKKLIPCNGSPNYNQVLRWTTHRRCKKEHESIRPDNHIELIPPPADHKIDKETQDECQRNPGRGCVKIFGQFQKTFLLMIVQRLMENNTEDDVEDGENNRFFHEKFPHAPFPSEKQFEETASLPSLSTSGGVGNRHLRYSHSRPVKWGRWQNTETGLRTLVTLFYYDILQGAPGPK